VTGAAGKLGRAVRTELSAAGHSLRLGDVRPIEHPEGEAIHLDITDGPAAMRAMEHIDAVAHLAFDGVGDYTELEKIQLNFDVNARGTHNLLWAAHACGVKRFVYTSTLSVFGHTIDLSDTMWDESSLPRPMDAYGLTKLFGEEACRMFARRFQLSVVVLRLCNLADDRQWKESQANAPQTKWESNWRVMTTHVGDAAHAIHLALQAPNIGFEIIHIAADNEGRLTKIQKAKDVLGFWPKWKLK